MSSFETGVKQIHISGVAGQIPVEVQSQLTPQEKILSSVTVNAGITTRFISNIINMDGYARLGVAVHGDSSHNFTANILASGDGSTVAGDPAITKTGATFTKLLVGEPGLNYAVLEIINNDAATRTYNVWARKYN